MAAMRANQALQAGAVSDDELQCWLAALQAEQAANRFLAGVTHLFVWGQSPA
jgi:hypothetical protein